VFGKEAPEHPVADRFYAVFHAHTYIGMMTSPDGLNWERARQYQLTAKAIPFDDGTVWQPDRMERPFVLTDEQGTPVMLHVACRKGDMSANIALPLSVGGSESRGPVNAMKPGE
jgi:hypothetical protein